MTMFGRRARGTLLPGALTVMLVVAACSGSDGADPITATTIGAGTATASTTAGTESPSDIPPAEVSLPPIEVVDPDGATRCVRLGYPCSWSDVTDQDLTAARDLADRVQEIVDAAPDPVSGVEAAVAYLAGRDDTVEIIPDRRYYTSIFWRTEGIPPSFVFTELAGPQGTLDDYDGPPIDGVETLDAFALADGINAVSASFHPTGGPLEPKRAIVLDPYAAPTDDCGSTLDTLLTTLGAQGFLDDDLLPGDCYMDKAGRTEGLRVAAIIGSHPQIDVTYLYGNDVTPWVITDLGAYDLVHIVSHGSSACASEEEQERIGSDACHTAFGLGVIEASPDNPRLPEGTFITSGGRFGATGEALIGSVKPTSIVFASHCTSGDGQLARQGAAGAFVGIHGYARMGVAERAAVEFWRMMAVEGVSFDVAVDRLVSLGLHESFPPQFDPYTGLLPTGVGHSTLVTGGDNMRARDVITTFVGAELEDGAQLESDDTVADGTDDTLPEVRFRIEGVEDGTAGGTTIEVLIDGKTLRETINLGEKGRVVDQQDGWAEWEVVIEDFDLEFDLKLEDVRPQNPKKHRWESRVYQRQSHYSADEADDVTFGGIIRAVGKIPLFDQLDAMPNSDLTLNELVIEFRSLGGTLSGASTTTLEGDPAGRGSWVIEFTDGSYDRDTGEITATANGAASGGLGSIFVSDTATGTMTGTVDFSTGVVSGTISFPGEPAAPFTAQIRG